MKVHSVSSSSKLEFRMEQVDSLVSICVQTAGYENTQFSRDYNAEFPFFSQQISNGYL